MSRLYQRHYRDTAYHVVETRQTERRSARRTIDTKIKHEEKQIARLRKENQELQKTIAIAEWDGRRRLDTKTDITPWTTIKWRCAIHQQTLRRLYKERSEN